MSGKGRAVSRFASRDYRVTATNFDNCVSR